MPRHLKNISNHLSIVDDVSKALEYIMNGNSEGIFGLELQLSDGAMSKTLVAPPYIRLGLEIPDSSIVYDDKELTVYEGYLVEPLFLPLYTELNGELLDELEKITVRNNEMIELQFLFRRKSDDWKDNVISMYGSYLEGNDYPFSSKLGRKIQDKVLGWLNKIGSFETKKEYIEEVEVKLLSQGFQFQLRVLIQSDTPEAVKNQLEEVFKRYDSHNALRLYKQKDKRFKSMYKERVLSYDTNTQILSRSEIVSLFGGKVPIVETVEDTVTKENKVETVETTKNTKTTDIISLLPEYPRQDVIVDPNIVSKLAEAMKRVGLITQARLYNESVIAGIRLTVVQCDIPRGKTLTHIASKSKDIQAALGVQSLGIEQGEGADTVKFAIPNEQPAVVSLRELIELKEFQEYAKKNPLSFIVGLDEVNNPIFLSLTKLVHLLCAGTTGSGKSVFINSLIICLIATMSPQLLRLVMIDPKQVELQQYKGFPHTVDVITDMSEAEGTLKQLVNEMEKRYTAFQEVGAKNISLYNQKTEKKMGYIVCIIDEYADLKDTNPKAEDYITRLGQKARAAGIHLIIATQRPDSKVLNGRIKANIQNAISFNLGNVNHYRTVFGSGINGVTLLGKGDGVMKIEGYPKTFQRFQSAIISPDESQEEKVFEDMRRYFANYKSKPLPTEEVEEKETVQEDDTLNKLKRIIAQTGETKVEPLRKQLSIKSATMTELMQQLVDEGFLVRHKTKAKGYEIVADKEELEKWI